METPLPPNMSPSLQEVAAALFNSAGEGLVVVDQTGTIVLANPRMEELFGHTPEDLQGQKMEILLPGRFRQGHHHHRDAYFQHPTRRTMGIGMDLTAVRRDGTEFPVEVSLNSFQVGGERLAMALITDISTRKKAEQDLEALNAELEERVRQRTEEVHQSQRLFSLIARNFPNGTINVFDRNLNYLFAEGKELYQMGVTSEMLTGTNFLEHLDPEIRDYIREKLMPVFGGEPATFELNHKGQEYQLHATALPGDNGDVERILVVEHNISRQKAAEREMIKTLAKERELNELKSRFVSMASHEFRTPLSTILTSLSLLIRHADAGNQDRRDKHVQRIRTSVHNLTGILNDFLSLDKLEAGAIGVSPETFNLQELAEKLVEELSAIAQKGQEIQFRYQGEAEVFLDPRMVQNVLTNLLSNAIKYSREDQAIDLEIEEDNGQLSITVRDRGIGIPQADQNHLFERFFRAGNATNIQGTGLGLNIVRKYLSLMQGTIDFKSKEGEGTVFFIHLPRIMDHEENTPDRRQS